MDHQIFNEMIQLALLDELNDDEMKKLHQHLIECSDCQAEYDRLNKYLSIINQNKSGAVDDELLQEARNQFRRKLNYDISRQSILEKLFSAFRKNIWIYKRPALAGAFSIAVGLFAGYLIFSPGSSSNMNLIGDKNGVEENATTISNVRFINDSSSTGEVAFTFDAIKQVTMRGKLSDPSVQRILAEALVNEKNPGTRIQTVNALANISNKQESLPTGKSNVNPKVKSALLTALKYDGNPAVRMEALKALLNFPFDNDINEALLFVLQRDKNSGLRIAAINGLASATQNGKTIDPETIKILNQKIKNDDNEYVRIRAASLIKEENIQ
ncbi:MAG: HEAT repeat domain-containing protein [Bacteroidetes bacterium]|nr:HEAT repeat domain-containing protein [Bacteroidota bacterium]